MHHAAQLGAVEMALHQAHHVFHEQVALHLHDGLRRGADEQQHEVIARLAAFVFVVFIEIHVVERDFDRRAVLGQVIEVHAQVIELLAEVFAAFHRPAHLQGARDGVVADAWLFLVQAGCAASQRARARVLPQGLERLFNGLQAGAGAQFHIAMHMDFKGIVIGAHGVFLGL